jgi:RNA polymerase sigma factor (sigma-70 family)
VTADAPSESCDEWAARVTRAVRGGSREALAEIYDRCANDVVALLERSTRRDESFALDCLQEMFMKLAANPPIVDTHATLLAWMRVTALNVARTVIVAENRRQRRDAAHAAVGVHVEVHDEVHVEVHVEDPATRQALAEITRQLDENERMLLRLRHVEGMRIRSIAVALGATPQAIESALRRIVARLRSGGAS